MPRFGTLDTQFLDDSGDPLVSGKIYFYEAGTTTLKNTYQEAAFTTANSNPVELTASGRLDHDVYFTGSIDAKLVTSAGVQVKSITDLGANDGVAFETYSSALSYDSGDIVEKDGGYYRSLVNDNQSNEPTTEADKWEEIAFIGVWNTNVTYAVNDIVKGSNGLLYSCITANSGNDPTTDTANTNWKLSAPHSVGDVVISADATTYTSPGWLECNGNAYSAATYAALASLLPAWYGKLADPATTPTSADNNGRGSPLTWSKTDDTYLTQVTTASPYIYIYKRSGDTFTKLSNPATLPAGVAYGCDFDSTDVYLAVSHGTSPYITIYKRSGDTFTKLSNPATLPAGIGYATEFSPDSNYLAVGHATSPYITVYSRSGDTFTKLSNPATLPGTTVEALAWDSTSTYLAVGCGASSRLYIYKRSGSTLTKLTDPDYLPSNNIRAIAWDSTDTYLFVGDNDSSRMLMYKRSGDTFTRISNDLGDIHSSIVAGATFDSDGNLYTAVNDSNTSRRIAKYTRVGDKFIAVQPDVTNIDPVGEGIDIQFSSTGTYLAVCGEESPFLAIHKKDANVLPRIVDEYNLTKGYIKTGL